jgi:hypothetical protein
MAGDSVAILNAGDVAAKQVSKLFDVALGEFLFFAECAKVVAYNHWIILLLRKICRSAYCIL